MSTGCYQDRSLLPHSERDLQTFILCNSTRETVRENLFDRVLEIGERNAGLDSDTLLSELQSEPLSFR